MIIGSYADGPWSHRGLEKLLANPAIKIAFICARYDRQGLVLSQKASKSGTPYLFHPDSNSSDFLARIDLYACDLLVSMSFNQIFRKHTIETPQLVTINCPFGPAALGCLGKEEIKINKVKVLQDAPSYDGVPGAVSAKNNQSFLGKALDSFVRVLGWESDNKMKVGDRLK
ncbi:hypothetical protein OAC78_08855 [Litorivicinus sp.]|nr:hypothetical protein [Litorivicinus sp.]